MTSQRPTHDPQTATDLPEEAGREDEVQDELDDHELEGVSGGNYNMTPPRPGVRP